MPGPRILVVEDDASILLGLQVNLEAEGYTVDTAVDGAKGLEKAREGWDLLILDLMMPEINGFEVLQTLRAEGNRVPVLVLSARGAEIDKVTGLDLGAEDYVTKVKRALDVEEEAPPPSRGVVPGPRPLGNRSAVQGR